MDNVREALLRLIQADRESRIACQALIDAIPPGVTVLACLEGQSGKPDTLYWSYSSTGKSLQKGVNRADECTKAMIVELPGSAVEDGE